MRQHKGAVTLDAFERYLAAALPPVMIRRDEEGWPFVLGKASRGYLEWRGPECDGAPDRLYACTGRRALRFGLRAIPGVHPWQVGDDEGVFWLRADVPTIRAVSSFLRLKRRPAWPAMSVEQRESLVAHGHAYRAARQEGHLSPKKTTRSPEGDSRPVRGPLAG